VWQAKKKTDMTLSDDERESYRSRLRKEAESRVETMAGILALAAGEWALNSEC